MTAQVFARVLESVRRHQPLAGTLFNVDTASAAVGGVAVRLPPWVGRGQLQQQDGRCEGPAASRAQDGSVSLPQSTVSGATSSGSASRVQERSWAAHASLPRPGFPVQRSPATSPQKPSAASAATVKAQIQPSPATSSVEASQDRVIDAAAEDRPSDASGAFNQQQETSRQQLQQQRAGKPGELAMSERGGALAYDAAAENSAAPSSARLATLKTESHDRSDVAAIATAAAQAADKPSASVISAEQAEKVSVTSSSAADQPVRTTDMGQRHEKPPISVAMQPTEDCDTAHSNLQHAPDSRGAEVAPADVWDGNDAALLAVIVEHAKVLHTINAGEAGSSCSLM